MRPITGEELCRRLNEAGWALKRIKAATTFSGSRVSGKSARFPRTEVRSSNPAWPPASPKTPGLLGEQSIWSADDWTSCIPQTWPHWNGPCAPGLSYPVSVPVSLLTIDTLGAG